MPSQVSLNNSNLPFVLFGLALTDDSAVIAQDAVRATPLVFGTVMSKIAGTQKWVPLTDVTSTTGAAIAQGIYIGADITAAQLVAGDVTDASIIVGDAGVDEQQLVLENSVTLSTVVAPGTINSAVVSDHLAYRGIFAEETAYPQDFSA